MAEGRRGLRFDRRLDAIATKKHAHRQRQRDGDTDERTAVTMTTRFARPSAIDTS